MGINQYHDSRIPELTGAENDAAELYERLNNPHVGGFSIPKDHFLIGKNATCQRIRKAVSDLFYKMDQYDLVLFYFSGHGFADGYGNGYIAPYDMIRDEPFVNGLNMREIKHVIANSVNKKSTMMVLDCCYSGISAKGDKAVDDDLSRKAYQENLSAIEGEGSIVLAATEADKKAREEEYTHGDGSKHVHGAFTFHIIEGLDGKAVNPDGIVTLGELVKYIGDETRGKQNYRMSVVYGNAIERIMIAKDPKKYTQTVDNLISEALSQCDKISIMTLHNCTEGVLKIASLDPKNQSVAQIKDRITQSLGHYKDKLDSYLTDNEVTLRPLVEKRTNDSELYAQLFKYEHYLSFDRFKDIQLVDLRRMSALCDLVDGRITPDMFIKRCSLSRNLLDAPSRGSEI